MSRLLFEFPEYEGTDFLENIQNYSIIGLETDHPIIRVDDKIFMGTYASTIGTHLLFNSESTFNSDHMTMESQGPEETNQANKATLSFDKKIHNKIIFKRIRVDKND